MNGLGQFNPHPWWRRPVHTNAEDDRGGRGSPDGTETKSTR
jgi:hypothetical protein